MVVERPAPRTTCPRCGARDGQWCTNTGNGPHAGEELAGRKSHGERPRMPEPLRVIRTTTVVEEDDVVVERTERTCRALPGEQCHRGSELGVVLFGYRRRRLHRARRRAAR